MSLSPFASWSVEIREGCLIGTGAHPSTTICANIHPMNEVGSARSASSLRADAELTSMPATA
jgi:hypothetical protein